MSDELDVTVAGGKIRGAAADDCRAWHGVPYAAPPVGVLRWCAPEPVPRWRGTRPAAGAGEAGAAGAAGAAGQPGAAEDCLYLDVCAPHGTPPAGGWPVLVFFGGGGGLAGPAELGPGEAFARDGIVVVRPGYRLGPFGFLNLAGVCEGAADSGVCGLLDQIAALRWTRANIAAFGGNPAQVTVYGQSAGAHAVGDLLGSPLARGLFAQAISSSGGAEHVASPGATVRVTRLFLEALGTRDRVLLWSAPAGEILAAAERVMPGLTGAWVWRPTIHRHAAPGLPLDAIGRGAAAKVRLLAGSNGNEAALFASAGGLAACVEPAYRNLCSILGRHRADQLLDVYRAERGGDDEHALLAGMGDERYTVGTVREADAQSAFAAVYRYRLDVAAPGMPRSLDGAHGADLFMAWQRPVPAAGPATRARRDLSAAVHRAWASFVKTGRPAAEGLPAWPGYSIASRKTMILDDASHVEADPRRHERLLWGDTRWEYGTWFPLPGMLPRSRCAHDGTWASLPTR